MLFLRMKNTQNLLPEKKTQITHKNPIIVVVQREFVGNQSLLEAFIPVIYEDIRRKLETNRTIDNNVCIT